MGWRLAEPAAATAAPDMHAAFLRAVLAEPEEDVHRLVLADWLEENGEPERAEFIRVQVELARGPAHAAFRGEAPGTAALRRRERDLLEAHGDRWRLEATGHVGCPLTGVSLFRRGFVSAVTLTAEAWLTHGPVLVRSAPLTRVTLSDKAPLKSEDEEDYRWARHRPALRATQASAWALPAPLFDALLPDRDCVLVRDGVVVSVRGYGSERHALDGLSAACLRLARKDGAP